MNFRATLRLLTLNLTLVILAAVAVPSFAHAAPDALDLNKSLDLKDYLGDSCFRMMTGKGGLRDLQEEDVTTKFKITDSKTAYKAREEFDPAVYKKLVAVFKDGQDGFNALIDALEGQSVTPQNISATIAKQLSDKELLKDSGKIGLAAVTLAPYISLVSGGGTVVHIDGKNYFYTFGYKPGLHDASDTSIDKATLDKAVKSGRNFGASDGGHLALDPSDPFYLKELAKYFSKTKSFTKFYKVMFTELIAIDPKAYSKLDPEGQGVETDFMAIYTAELTRHLMTGLVAHPWENDIAEVNMVAAFVSNTGKIMDDNGKLVDGSTSDFFDVGKQGSGIGEKRKVRRALQTAISKAILGIEGGDKIAKAVTDIIGQPKSGDLFRGVMEFLNNDKTQATVAKNGADLIDALVNLMDFVADNSDTIEGLITHH